MSPTGGADTRVCRAETRFGALQRLDTIVEAADTSVRATLAGKVYDTVVLRQRYDFGFTLTPSRTVSPGFTTSRCPGSRPLNTSILFP